MGRFYLQLIVAALTLGFEANVIAQRGDSIALPPPPRPVLPPARENDDPNDHVRKSKERRRMLDQQRKSDQPLPPTKAELKKKELAKETATPRPQRLGMEVSLVFPDILVSGNRESYTTDVTSHFNVFIRSSSDQNTGSVGFWYGARMGAFSGSGIYKDVPGRYGFLYFGPMIGLGKIDPPPKDFGQDSAGAMDWANFTFTRQQGWLVTTGLSVQSRSGVIDPSDEDVDKDFDGEGITFDAPGLWAETRYLLVHYGALHTAYFAGAHFGDGKIFGYLGIGVGGWY